MDMAWGSFRLAVFDVDGTLYDQRRLRLVMAVLLGLECVRSRSARVVRILRHYRQRREQLADAEIGDFERVIEAELEAAHGSDGSRLRDLVTDWMETRPLPYLVRARRPGVADLFQRLRADGKTIGVLSDYPAHAKIAAMGLDADVVVSATDPEVNLMKPNPAGLQRVMALAGMSAQETIMIGDRAERDGEAGRRAGVRTLIVGGETTVDWLGVRDLRDIWPTVPPQALP